MPDTVYYMYNRQTGAFAGSGLSDASDENYAATTAAPPDAPQSPELYYDLQTEEWKWWIPVSL